VGKENNSFWGPHVFFFRCFFFREYQLINLNRFPKGRANAIIPQIFPPPLYPKKSSQILLKSFETGLIKAHLTVLEFPLEKGGKARICWSVPEWAKTGFA